MRNPAANRSLIAFRRGQALLTPWLCRRLPCSLSKRVNAQAFRWLGCACRHRCSRDCVGSGEAVSGADDGSRGVTRGERKTNPIRENLTATARLLVRVMRHGWSDGVYRSRAARVRLVNFPHAPAATDIKKPRKTQSEHCGKKECQKRPEENQDGDYAKQKL